MKQNDFRNPILDGWRGIAIIFVLIEHVNSALGKPLAWMPSLGQHGVTIFFVLSGYLITGKLLEPNTSLKQFYLRRMFRLMPVAWSFLFVTWLIGALAHVQMIWPKDVITCILFVRNYAGDFGRAATTHYWSLSIEEQFYLVWPMLLLLLGIRRARWFAAGAAIFSYALLVLYKGFYETGMNMLHTEVRADGLLVGCLFAMFLHTDEAKQQFNRIAKLSAIPCICAVIYFIFSTSAIPTLPECVAWGVLVSGSSISLRPRVLAWKPLTWIGRISYSIYVWNLLVIAIFYAYPKPALFALLIAVPAASYYLIEQPMQKFGSLLLKKEGRPYLMPCYREALTSK